MDCTWHAVQSRSRLSFQLHQPKTYLIFVWSSKIRLKPKSDGLDDCPDMGKCVSLPYERPTFWSVLSPKKKDDGKNYNDLEAQKQREAFKRKILSPESLFSGLGLWFRFRLASHTYIKWFVAPGSDSLISLLLYIYAWFPSPSGLIYARSKRRLRERISIKFFKNKKTSLWFIQKLCVDYLSDLDQEESWVFTSLTKRNNKKLSA